MSALARCTLGEMFADPESDALAHRLINETAMVGRAEGANISDEDVEALYNVARDFSNASAIKTSTLAGPRARQAPGVRREKRRRGARRATPRA